MFARCLSINPMALAPSKFGQARQSGRRACAAGWLQINYLYVKILTRGTDSIDRIRAQWKVARPDLDTRPMEIVGRILRIEFIASARIRKVLQRHRIDWGGFDVLATLRRSGAPYRMTPTALYRELVLSSGAMTNRLDVLERAGLVERLPDPNDRRGTLIELTKEGKVVLDRALEAHLQGEAQLVAHLPRDEQKRLADLLKRLLIEMESESEDT
jgi:DNA-binding MarR family transcriptional regulator